MENPAKGITWNLNDLYASAQDAKIENDLTSADLKSIEFEKKYKPLFEKPAQLSSHHLANLLNDYKAIVTLMRKPMIYAHLSFAEKTNAPGVGAFLQKIQTKLTDIQAHLLFWEISWSKLDEKAAEKLMNEPALKNDLHLLGQIRKYSPHTLNEGEEKIMAVKDNTGGSAFSRLFDEIMNNIPFYIEADGKRVKKTEGEILNLLHSTDRSERKEASQSLAEGLKDHTHILTYIYNMILADHRSSLKIRKYKHPMDSRNLANEIELETVQRMTQNVKRAYPVAARYYKLKQKLLGLNELYDYDRYAPIDTEKETIDFNQCKEIVLSGYDAFSEEVGKVVEQFFDKRWIDAEIREGKQGGGFCAETTPDLHPYILVNYTGSMRDVMTVAHELGHGLHQFLARRAGILESSAPLTMAETASVFGEMLIFETILSREKDRKKKLSLICGKIDDNFSTVFRQICLTDFELLSHETGMKEGELSSDQLSHFWIKANSEFYGDSVVLTDEYRHSWKYIPHFVHTPFYCYAYAFAQLFVLSLFQKYKSNQASFVPNYLEMLALGGSRKPEELAQMVGLDLTDSNFWNSGIKILDDWVKQAEELAK